MIYLVLNQEAVFPSEMSENTFIGTISLTFQPTSQKYVRVFLNFKHFWFMFKAKRFCLRRGS